MFSLSAKAHLERQNHSFKAHSHFQRQWWNLNPQIQVRSVSFLSFIPAIPSQMIEASSPAVPKQAEPCQT